ncbi:E3 ubiquitin-protein ligase rnf168-like [Macrobrachium nipponense]|uniref:E3 ubiquitin-protein ligase rnf168-like n=1 Tax=Macrobrachium nipponense TaxID=159736 RepID=UPI0030C7E3DB
MVFLKKKSSNQDLLNLEQRSKSRVLSPLLVLRWSAEMTSHPPMECGICHEILDGEERCPLLLPCCHSVCAACIGQLVDNDSNSCPFCRKVFSGTSTKSFSPNFALLDMLNYVKRSEDASERPFPKMRKRRAFEEWFKGIENDTDKICRENKVTCCDIENLMERLSKLEKELRVSNRKIDNEITRDLMETKKANEKLVRYIQEVKENLKSFLSEAKGRQLDLEEKQSNLKPTENFISSSQLLDETEKSGHRWKEELMKEKVLVNGYRKHTNIIAKVAEKCKSNLTVTSGALTSCLALEEEEVEFLKCLNEKIVMLQWTNSRGYMAEEKLQKVVCAVQRAVVFLAGNSRMLRSLFEEKLPMLGATVHDAVISPLRNSSIMMFLLEKKQQMLDKASHSIWNYQAWTNSVWSYQAWTRMRENTQRRE